MPKNTIRPRVASIVRPRSSGANVPPLPRLVQEHLGKELRAGYYENGEKPQYLGDPTLPLEFDFYLHRLAQRERSDRAMHIREKGAQAVADALSDLLR